MDLNVAIQERIRGTPGLTGCHVGEVVPHSGQFPYVFVSRGSEEYSEDLCFDPDVDIIRYDIEVVDGDLDRQRDITRAIKSHLKTTPLHSIEFINDDGERQTLHGIIVQDHGDNYVPRNPNSEERAHIAAIDVEAIMGELV